ncbi:hypothetical protein [Thiocystis violacea]|uniref:hypothetical protein n=1 Tax=Thiocystis violacea TaxID=13725 RepID=UPI00190620AD|nr:hypothetical protein [Thiocystis violacea]MBK1719187.1 hypothetical protein [Thiocystis violacea]
MSAPATLISEIQAVIEAATRPLTAADVFSECLLAESPTQVCTAISHLKRRGLVREAGLVHGTKNNPRKTWVAARDGDDPAPPAPSERRPIGSLLSPREAPSDPLDAAPPLTDQERDRLARILAQDVGELAESAALDAGPIGTRQGPPAIDSEWPDALETASTMGLREHLESLRVYPDKPDYSAHGSREADEFDAPNPAAWTDDRVRDLILSELCYLTPVTFSELTARVAAPKPIVQRVLLDLFLDGSVGRLSGLGGLVPDYGYYLNGPPSQHPRRVDPLSPPKQTGHFIARMIRDAPDPKPKLLEAASYAEALDACGERLEAGRAIPSVPEISALFSEMAGFMRELA